MAASQDPMSPDASPGTLRRDHGVRRVNNVPLYLAGVALLAFTVILSMTIARQAADQARAHGTPLQMTVKQPAEALQVAKANEIIGDHPEGIVAPKERPAGDPRELALQAPPGAVSIVRPDENLDLPPRPYTVGMPTASAATLTNAPMPAALHTPEDDERDRLRVMKQQQFDEAVKGSSSVAMTGAKGQGLVGPDGGAPVSRDTALSEIDAALHKTTDASSGDPVASYRNQLAALQAVSPGGAADGRGPPDGGGRGNTYGQFSGASDRWRSRAHVEKPASAFELRAGFVIPATLVSGIQSDIPGQIIGQVSHDVYDTATGRNVLLPQGARLVGAFSSEVAYGQARVLVAWQRIVFPDGKALDLGAMPGADGVGYSGFSDQVDNHYLRIFGSAFLLSGITAGVALSQPPQSPNTVPSTSSALSQALGQQLGTTTAQLIQKNLNIAPTLNIRPGYRFNVMVTKDLAFPSPYRSFDYSQR